MYALEKGMTKSLQEEVTAAMEVRKEDQYPDPFQMLPDEVLRLILNKVSDAKSLFRCSLVSKPLASVLSRHNPLSIRFFSYNPVPKTPSQKLKSSSRSFLLKPFLRQNTTPKPRLSDFKHVFVGEDQLLLWLTRFLPAFPGVRSLHVELLCTPHCRPGPRSFRFSWVFEGKKLKTFAFLSASSITMINDAKEEGNVSERPQNSMRWSAQLIRTAASSVLYATLVSRRLLLLVSRHPNIETVKITDSNKHGEISLQGEQLVKLKDKISEEMVLDMNRDLLQRRFSLWHADKLRLPRSGLVMEEVTLGASAVDRFPGRGGDTDGLVAEFANNGDDIFGEALTGIRASSSLKRQSYKTCIRFSNLIALANP